MNNNLKRFYLMLSFVVNLHGAKGTRGEAAARNVAVERRLTAVGIQVFAQVDHILTPCKHKIKCGSIKKKSNAMQECLASTGLAFLQLQSM